MDISKVNKYLSKLEGPGLIEKVTVDKQSNIEEVKIKFCGDTGTIDIGEIELSFFDVEILNLPQGFMTPIQLSLGSDLDVKNTFNVNYIERDCNLYYIEDSENVVWYIYASSFEVNVLPVYYG